MDLEGIAAAMTLEGERWLPAQASSSRMKVFASDQGPAVTPPLTAHQGVRPFAAICTLLVALTLPAPPQNTSMGVLD